MAIDFPLIKQLLAGYKAFHAERFMSDCTLYHDLVEHGQSSKVLVICCSDSRVDPAIMFKCNPGDLFVVRNVANLVPAMGSGDHSVSSALEYGVCALHVEHIVIIGHRYCGGIQALMNFDATSEQTQCIPGWINHAQPARAKVSKAYKDNAKEEQYFHCERQSLVDSLANCMSYPWLKEQVDAGTLTLHAWHFDLDSGCLHAYSAQSDSFEAL